MTLDECREKIGHGVVYDPGYPGARREAGVLVDVGPVYAMVRYGEWVKATPPESLTLLAGEPPCRTLTEALDAAPDGAAFAQSLLGAITTYDHHRGEGES